MASNSSELGGLQEQREVIAAQGVRQEFVVGAYDLERCHRVEIRIIC